MQIASISEELAKKTEDAARQQEEITHLLSQIVDLQKKAKAVSPGSSQHKWLRWEGAITEEGRFLSGARVGPGSA